MTKATTTTKKTASPAKKPVRTAMRDPKGLTGAEEAYACLLAQGTMSQADAYRQAFPRSQRWKDAAVWPKASILAGSDKVRVRVAELMKLAAERNEVTVTDVLRGYLNILRADPRKLIGYKRGSCRYCYGAGHRYQFTAAEFERAELEHDPMDGEFDPKGGIGFNPNRAPNPECPECWGDGKGRVIVGDTSTFGELERSLYAGVKLSKDGIEVRMHDQMAALGQLARHVGFFELDNEVKVSGDLVPSELDAIYNRRMASARAKSAEARGRPARLFGGAEGEGQGSDGLAEGGGDAGDPDGDGLGGDGAGAG